MERCAGKDRDFLVKMGRCWFSYCRSAQWWQVSSYHDNHYKDGLPKKTPMSNTKSEADTRVPVIEIRQIQTHLPYSQPVPAGFPSPADDYAEEQLNLAH
jgi:hypothetical protein